MIRSDERLGEGRAAGVTPPATAPDRPEPAAPAPFTIPSTAFAVRMTGIESATILDAELREALARRLPAAWAWFHDVVLPHVRSILREWIADPSRVQALADEVTRRLHATAGDPVTERGRLLERVRGLAARAVADAILVEGPRLVRDEIAADFPPQDGAAPPPGAAERAQLAAVLLAHLPDALVAQDLLTLRRAAPPPEPRRRARVERILDLPAVLAVTFLVAMTAASWLVLRAPAAIPKDLQLARLMRMVREGDFDAASRLLATAPPDGLTGLRPVLPEQRRWLVDDFAKRPFEGWTLRLLGPRGLVPRDAIAFELRGSGDIELIVVDSDRGRPIASRTVTAGAAPLRLDVGFEPGTWYTVAVRRLAGPPEEQRARFKPMTAAEEQALQQELAAVLARAGDPDLASYFAGHVYRAHGCLQASVEAWRRFAASGPAGGTRHRYGLAEAALALEQLGLPDEAVRAARESLRDE